MGQSDIYSSSECLYPRLTISSFSIVMPVPWLNPFCTDSSSISGRSDYHLWYCTCSEFSHEPGANPIFSGVFPSSCPHVFRHCNRSHPPRSDDPPAIPASQRAKLEQHQSSTPTRHVTCAGINLFVLTILQYKTVADPGNASRTRSRQIRGQKSNCFCDL